MHSISKLKMKLLVLVFLVTIVVSISISFSSNTPLYQNLFLDSLPQTHDQLDHQRSLLSASPVTKHEVFHEYDTYFMSVGVGTPPQNVYLSLDTGSDVVWLQCLPCKECYTQSEPIFDPRESSTFSPLACGDSRCKQLQSYFDGCDNINTSCLYIATYSDLSFSQGTFSTETLKLGRKKKLKNIALGCGHDNQGWSTKSAGVIGLGRGNLSFITQTKHLFQGQFSYCLAFWFSTTAKSYIVFGPSAVPTRKADVYYTPLIYTNTTTTFYYVNLTEISVNGTRVHSINSSVSDLKPNGEGGVIIDSGTKYTRLVNEEYLALRDAFRAAVQKSNSSLGSPGNFSLFDTCYNISGKSSNVYVPTVELHFDQGANMTLGPDNTMVEMYDDGTVAIFCFAFVSSEWYTTIGNFQQQSFQIVHDHSRVGFVPDSC